MIDSVTADRAARLADQAAEAVRTISHLTVLSPPLPAPDVYLILGHLEDLGYRLDHTLDRLAESLADSLNAYDLVEDDPALDPETSIADALTDLEEARRYAAALGQQLGSARSAIQGVGYRDPRDGEEL